ncbi:MAG: DUF1640 domain-containing protein [Lamprocystis purpurea]|jgi:hypothetical protein|uniref:hypothetical protein n=1 Tax=Lamprocystis purpurea TaxID=61598 RepID=UPI000373369C|nr:hypothetical protein [Lamprocystis purpurea]MBV5275821.1 DUF1640 domain-containing protein [Lamprocystis purpurea]
MATSVVQLYEALATAPDERARARVIAEAFERLEERYPHLPDLVTQGHLRESELRLQKEIAQVRADLSETELRLQKEIAQVRADLTVQIEQLRGAVKTDIEQLRGEVKTGIERSRNSLLLWLIPLMFAQVGAIAALVKLL